MCYEFVENCKRALIDRIVLSIGEENFFLVCIGHLNYFYCNDKSSVHVVKQLLNDKGVALHNLSEQETLSVVNAPVLQEYEYFYGNQTLMDKLQEKWRAA